jgi:hypothetical protein
MKKIISKRSCGIFMIVLLTVTISATGCSVGAKSSNNNENEIAMNMKYPAFFDEIDSIVLKDELGEFIGTSESGIIEITYLDTVKMAGHSCAVVGGAYLMASEGLKALYGIEIPQRGEIIVEIKKSPTEENAGVVGCVLSNITGATTDDGFGGIPGGRFNRRNLLFYNAPIDTDIRFTRIDTKKQIGLNYHPGKAVNPMAILMSAIGPDATAENKKTFPKRFQKMVKTLFENKDKVIDVIDYSSHSQTHVKKTGEKND